MKLIPDSLRRQIDAYFADPARFPAEYLWWLRRFFEDEDISVGGRTGHIDSTENVELPWGVQSIEPGGNFEAVGDVLQADGAGGSLWGPASSGGGFETFRECVLANPNAVYFWPCDEPSGNLTDIVSGNVLTPVVADVAGTNYPIYGQTGPFTAEPAATAVRFAGVYGVLAADNDRFEGGMDTSIFSGTNPWTIDMWVEQLSLPTLVGGYLFLMEQSTTPLISIAVDVNGYLYVGRGGSGSIVANIAQLLTIGEYFWVRVSYNGSTLKLFMNTVEMASDADSGSLAAHTAFAIGNHRGTGSSSYMPFNGRVSNIAIYNTALTSFCDLNPDGSSNALEFQVLTANGSGSTYWDYPTVEVEL